MSPVYMFYCCRTSEKNNEVTQLKYVFEAAHSMLAIRVSFINEILKISEAVGTDINKIKLGIGYDKRIGYSFLYH